MIQKLFVTQFRGINFGLRYKITKTLNLEDFLSTAEIGKVLTGKQLQNFAENQRWEIEIS